MQGANLKNLITVHDMIWDLPSLLLTNARSLNNKFDELELVAKDNGADIICVTETWMNSEIPDSVATFSGYLDPIRNDRKEKRGGGVLIYVKDSIKTKHWEELYDEEFETLWLTVHPPKLPRSISCVIIGIVYHPPKANSFNLYKHICSSLDHILNIHPQAGIILSGDFNHFKDSQIKNIYKMTQVIDFNTRGNKILDKIFTNLDQLYNTPKSFAPLGKSDHSVIMYCPTTQPNYKHPITKTILRRSGDANGKAFFVNEMKQINWKPLYDLNYCNDKFHFFMSSIQNLLDYYLPYVEVKVNSTDKPWINSNYKDLIIKRQIAWVNNNKKLYNIYRNKVNRATKCLRKKYFKSQVQNLRETNASQWWRKTKEIVGLGKNNSALTQLAVSQFGGDNKVLVREANKALSSVSDHLSPLNTNNIPLQSDDIPAKYTISTDDVEKALSNIKLNKSPGPDDIPNWVLRDLSPLISGPITSIFNSSIREGFVPKLWKLANVTIIPKVNVPKFVKTDLRPISLTPVLSKILESFISEWLWDSVKDKLHNNQYGGIPGLSTGDALVKMVHKWQTALHNHEAARILFLDYRKAFDLVDHNILISKLVSYNVPNFIVRWIGSFLSNRLQRVKLGEEVSDWIKLNGSVPQGSTLGPLLFVIMIDDLQVNSDGDIFKFMDDSTVSETIPKSKNSKMQELADSVSTWTEINNMEINAIKTKEMLMCSLQVSPIYPPININNSMIESVNKYKLLGLIITDDLTWNNHTNEICNKANKRLYYLILLRRAGLSQQDLMTYYKQIIRPVLEYCCQVWHNNLSKTQSDKIENIQDRAIKIISSAPNNGCVVNDLESLKTRREKLCIKYFNKIRTKQHILSDLLPKEYDHGYDTRNKTLLPKPMCKTNRFKNSFINYGLLNFQKL